MLQLDKVAAVIPPAFVAWLTNFSGPAENLHAREGDFMRIQPGFVMAIRKFPVHNQANAPIFLLACGGSFHHGMDTRDEITNQPDLDCHIAGAGSLDKHRRYRHIHTRN
ncbi:MAG TPA: hypothetical protein VMV70_05800 [Gallionella sp.]|nr:hypothetical protein [Gallionella sp.]